MIPVKHAPARGRMPLYLKFQDKSMFSQITLTNYFLQNKEEFL